MKLKTGIRAYAQVDKLVRSSFDLKDPEWALIEDRVEFTLKDYFAGLESPARQPTSRMASKARSVLLQNA
jgi:hypothetical protein